MVGVSSVTAVYANEQLLGLPVVRCDMTALGTGLARMGRVDIQNPTFTPFLLVFQLPGELYPALLEDGLVESGLLFSVFAWCFLSPSCRASHVFHLKILQQDDSVVFADFGGDLAKVIVSCIGNVDVQPVDTFFLLVPVVRSFHLSGEFSFFFGKFSF